jgi:hypothetical protein
VERQTAQWCFLVRQGTDRLESLAAPGRHTGPVGLFLLRSRSRQTGGVSKPEDSLAGIVPLPRHQAVGRRHLHERLAAFGLAVAAFLLTVQRGFLRLLRVLPGVLRLDPQAFLRVRHPAEVQSRHAGADRHGGQQEG